MVELPKSIDLLGVKNTKAKSAKYIFPDMLMFAVVLSVWKISSMVDEHKDSWTLSIFLLVRYVTLWHTISSALSNKPV